MKPGVPVATVYKEYRVIFERQGSRHKGVEGIKHAKQDSHEQRTGKTQTMVRLDWRGVFIHPSYKSLPWEGGSTAKGSSFSSLPENGMKD